MAKRRPRNRIRTAIRRVFTTERVEAILTALANQAAAGDVQACRECLRLLQTPEEQIGSAIDRAPEVGLADVTAGNLDSVEESLRRIMVLLDQGALTDGQAVARTNAVLRLVRVREVRTLDETRALLEEVREHQEHGRRASLLN